MTADDGYSGICASCFADFRDQFRWTMIETEDQADVSGDPGVGSGPSARSPHEMPGEAQVTTDNGAMDEQGYEQRAREGEALALAPTTAEVRARLLQLLLDPWDTAVTYRTALALLARHDPEGVGLVVRAAAATKDSDTEQWLFSAFGEVRAASLGSEDAFLRRALRALVDGDDAAVALEASEISDWLGL